MTNICGKNCEECDYRKANGCVRCVNPHGIGWGSDCKITACVRTNQVNSCESCHKRVFCDKYTERFAMPKEREEIIEDKKKKTAIAKKSIVPLWIHFGIDTINYVTYPMAAVCVPAIVFLMAMSAAWSSAPSGILDLIGLTLISVVFSLIAAIFPIAKGIVLLCVRIEKKKRMAVSILWFVNVALLLISAILTFPLIAVDALFDIVGASLVLLALAGSIIYMVAELVENSFFESSLRNLSPALVRVWEIRSVCVKAFLGIIVADIGILFFTAIIGGRGLGVMLLTISFMVEMLLYAAIYAMKLVLHILTNITLGKFAKGTLNIGL